MGLSGLFRGEDFGQEFPERPSHTLDGTLLTVHFESGVQFTDYTRRAFRVKASRLVAFIVDGMTETRVACRCIFNHTPILRVVGTIIDPDGDDSDISVFQITPQSNNQIITI